MEYTVKLSEQQVELLKSILAQIEPTQLIFTPVSKLKKLSKAEQDSKDMREHMREYRARKAALKAERERKKRL
jgi:hypothetical protein